MDCKDSQMTKRADNDLINELHNELASTLLERIRSGEATAADLQAARGFLKDNNVTALPVKNSVTDKLAQELPFSPADEIDESSFH